MLNIQVVNLEQIAAAISHIPGAVEKAVKISAKKTLQGAKKDAIAKVRQRYTSPIGIFSRSLQVKASAMGGSLISKGAKNPLEKFKTAPKGRITQRGSYIKATVVKGQGGISPKAFRKTGGESIFERLGRSRMPIKKLKSVAAPSMLGVSQVREPVMQQIESRFAGEFISAAGDRKSVV